MMQAARAYDPQVTGAAVTPERPGTPAHIASIRERYIAEARGTMPLTVDLAILAFDRALSDALADLCEQERRSRRQDRLISRGYVRAEPQPRA